ncbi:MAG: hypothetical protein V4519_04660 [Patescibacteria group bacterium]
MEPTQPTPVPQTPAVESNSTPVQNTPPVQSYDSAPSPKSPASKWIAIIVLLLLVAGVAAAAYKFAEQKLEPKQVLLKAYEKAQTTKSAYFSANAKFNVQAEKDTANNIIAAESAEFTLKMEGSSDVTNPDSPKVDLTMGGDISAKTEKGDISGKIDLSARGIDDQIYIKLNDFSVSYTPVTPDPLTAGIIGFVEGMVSGFKGKWIITEEATSTVTTNDIPQEVKDELNKFEYIESIENMGDEKINGVNSYHYKIRVNTDMLFKILAKAEKDAEVQKKMEEYIVRGTDKQNPVVEVWIGKSDFNIYKVVLNPAVVDDIETKTTITMQGEMVIKDYNKPVTVEAPKDAVELETIIEEAFGGLLGPSVSAPATPSKTPTPIKTR